MKNIIALICSPLIINKDSINLLIKSDEVTEVILFSNGAGDLTHQFESDKVGHMETEIEISLDKVYRQIISFIHHTHSDGTLYILRGGDKLNNLDFLWNSNSQNSIIVPESEFSVDAFSDDSNKMDNLLYLNHPFSFIPILDVSSLNYALTSRNLLSYVSYFIKGGWTTTKSIEVSIPEVSIMQDKYLGDLLNPDFIEDKAIKLVINYLRSRDNEKSSSLQI